MPKKQPTIKRMQFALYEAHAIALRKAAHKAGHYNMSRVVREAIEKLLKMKRVEK